MTNRSGPQKRGAANWGREPLARASVILSVFGILMALVVLPGCRREGSGGRPLVQVSLACTADPQSTLVHIARAKGYFAEAGLEVQVQRHAFGKAALQAVLEGKADFATAAETPLVFAVLRGEYFFVIANIESSSHNSAIVGRRDAGIRSPRDLKGKAIGFTPGTTSDFFLDSVLLAQGLLRSDIRPVSLRPEEMQAALLGGKVAAVCTWNYPLTQIYQALGANAFLHYDPEVYTETFNLIASTDIVERQPEVAQSLLRALLKAEAFVAARPAEAQAIVATASGVDPQLVAAVWEAYNFKVRFDQTLLITLEDETRWAMRNGLSDQKVMPDFRKHIYLDPLRAVRPEAVWVGR